MAPSGCFITFEGIEGCGKTTQIGLAASFLRGLGLPVTTTREPGGTVIGGRIREILLHRENTHLSPAAELLLYGADRAQHVAEIIQPALALGDIVLCDRFSDATIAYQGIAREAGVETVRFITDYAARGLAPDLTILLDIDTIQGLARARQRAASTTATDDRFEREALSFHERVRNAYLLLARQEPARFKVIDAAPEQGIIAGKVQAVILDILAGKGYSFAV